MVESDRRRHPRVPVQIDVAYDNDVFLVNASLRDLSLGGAHILTTVPLPVGTRLSLIFRGEEIIDLSAEVLRVTEEDPDEPELAVGMAVQFLEVSSYEQTSLSELIEAYLDRPEEVAEEEVAEEVAAEEVQVIGGDAPVVPEPSPSLEETVVEEPVHAREAPAAPLEHPDSQELIRTVRIPPPTVRANMPEADPFTTIRMEPPSEAQDPITTIRMAPPEGVQVSLESTQESPAIDSESSESSQEMPALNENGEPVAPPTEKRSKRKKKR